MAGLLDDAMAGANNIYQGGAPVRNAIMGLLSGDASGFKSAFGQVKSLFDPEYMKQVKPMSQADAMSMAMDVNPILHTVYHGSPHAFDKFDMSKIGTGEGAQAYGHGLYFAESPDVAGAYVGGNKANTAFVDGKNAADVLSNKTALSWLEKSGGNPKVAIDFLNNELEYFTKTSPSFSARREISDAISEINSLSGKVQGAGNMYKVDIPDEAIPKMLDWDKPLSQQNEDVLKKLNSMFSITRNKVLNKDVAGNEPTGGLIYNRLQELMSGGKKNDAFANTANYGQKIATDELKDLGITGIRYLDSNSRANGGSSNFVLFDDSLPKILERNGQPMSLLK